MPASRNIIVTAANDLYFPLVLNLLESLRALRFSIPFDIGVLDVGFGESAKAQLAPFNVQIIPAGVDIEYPDRMAWEKQLFAFRAMTARPYLRKYFPGYDVIMWMDADTWVQTPEAIETMLAGAGGDESLFIASEIDRDYRPYFLSSQPWEHHLKWYRANFPAEKVTAIFPRPMLNSGVWAMNASSPVWRPWGDECTACLQGLAKVSQQQFMSEQLSLNMAVYTHGLPLKVMPAEYNWLTLFTIPMYDSESKLLVRPTPPRTTISIIHLTHEKKMRSFDLATTDGKTISRTLLNG